jgi:hypothetical protein
MTHLLARTCLALTMAMLLGTNPANAASTERTAQLQRQVQQVIEHMRLRRETMLSSEAQLAQRYALLGAALEAWNQSDRTDADADLMQGWLDQAIASSALGGQRTMPELPTFPQREAIPAPVAKASPENPTGPVPTDADAPAYAAQYEPYDSFEAAAAPQEQPDVESPPAVVAASPTKTIATKPVAPAPETPKTPDRGWASHPASDIDWGDPFVDDPLASDALSTTAQTTKRFKPVTGDRQVKIDLLELSSRVAGHNARLRELEGRLVGARQMNAFRLAALLRDLDDLQEQRAFLQLYLAGLSAEETSIGPELASAEPLVRLATSAVTQRQEDLEGDEGSQAEAERAILTSLSRKLQDLRVASLGDR